VVVIFHYMGYCSLPAQAGFSRSFKCRKVCHKYDHRIVHVISCGRAKGVVGWFVVGQYWWVHMVVPFVVFAIMSTWGIFLAVGSWFVENISM